MVIQARADDITELFRVPTTSELNQKIKDGIYKRIDLEGRVTIPRVLEAIEKAKYNQIVVLPKYFNKKTQEHKWDTKGTPRRIKIKDEKRRLIKRFPFELIYEDLAKLKKYGGRTIYPFLWWTAYDNRARARRNRDIIEGKLLQQYCKSDLTEEEITFDHLTCEHEFVANVPSRSEKGRTYKLALMKQPILFGDPLQKYQLFGKEFNIKGKKYKSIYRYCYDAYTKAACEDILYHFDINQRQEYAPWGECAHAIAAREELMEQGEVKFKGLDWGGTPIRITPVPRERFSDFYRKSLTNVATRVDEDNDKIKAMTKKMAEALTWNFIGRYGVEEAYRKWGSEQLIEVI